MKKLLALALTLVLSVNFIGCADKTATTTGADGTSTTSVQVSNYEKFVSDYKKYIPIVVKGAVGLAMSELNSEEKVEFAKWGYTISSGIHTALSGTLPDLEKLELIIKSYGQKSPELDKYNYLTESVTGFLEIKVQEIKDNFNNNTKATLNLFEVAAKSLEDELLPYLNGSK